MVVGNPNRKSDRSMQGEARRLAAEIGSRIERLALQRTVAVLHAERLRRRDRIIGELAIPRQHLGAAIEPGTLAHIDAGAALLVLHVRSAGSVIGPATVIQRRSGLRGGRRGQAPGGNEAWQPP